MEPARKRLVAQRTRSHQGAPAPDKIPSIVEARMVAMHHNNMMGSGALQAPAGTWMSPPAPMLQLQHTLTQQATVYHAVAVTQTTSVQHTSYYGSAGQTMGLSGFQPAFGRMMMQQQQAGWANPSTAGLLQQYNSGLAFGAVACTPAHGQGTASHVSTTAAGTAGHGGYAAPHLSGAAGGRTGGTGPTFMPQTQTAASTGQGHLPALQRINQHGSRKRKARKATPIPLLSPEEEDNLLSALDENILAVREDSQGKGPKAAAAGGGSIMVGARQGMQGVPSSGRQRQSIKQKMSDMLKSSSDRPIAEAAAAGGGSRRAGVQQGSQDRQQQPQTRAGRSATDCFFENCPSLNKVLDSRPLKRHRGDAAAAEGGMRVAGSANPAGVPEHAKEGPSSRLPRQTSEDLLSEHMSRQTLDPTASVNSSAGAKGKSKGHMPPPEPKKGKGVGVDNMILLASESTSAKAEVARMFSGTVSWTTADARGLREVLEACEESHSHGLIEGEEQEVSEGYDEMGNDMP